MPRVHIDAIQARSLSLTLLSLRKLQSTSFRSTTVTYSMSGCQQALLLTRQPTPAVPLQEVSLALHLTTLQVPPTFLLTTCCFPCLFKLDKLLCNMCCYSLTYATGWQACANTTQELSPARSLSAHRSLSHLDSIPEEQLQSNCEQLSCSQGQRQSRTEEQTPVLLKEKFPAQVQYVPAALRRQSPQGSCNLPTVFSGQLV